MPDPPFRPNYFQAINYVVDVWAQPCEAPWYIYARTFGPAALAALITLASFGWDDVFRGYVRPKGLRARKFKKKPFRIKGVPIRFPEIGELLGKRLYGAKRFQGTKHFATNASLWRIDGVLQRGMFYWLLADIAVDFAFEFSSVMYATEWCAAENLPRHSNRGDPFQLGPAGGSWHDFNCPTIEYQKGDISFGQHDWLNGDVHARFGGGGKFHDHLDGGGRARLRLLELPSLNVHSLGDWVSWVTGEEARPFVVGRMLPFRRYSIQWAAETPATTVKISERFAFAHAEHIH